MPTDRERLRNRRPTEQILQWGSLGTSGSAVLLLLAVLNTQGDHTNEIGALQLTVNQIIRHDLEQAKSDIARLTMLEMNPKARPNAWTKTDDDQRMQAFEGRILELMRLERERWVGSEPLHLQQLLDIQEAIAGIPTDAPDAWTKDGKPRTQAVADRYGGHVTETIRDRAWTLLEMARQAARTIRR